MADRNVRYDKNGVRYVKFTNPRTGKVEWIKSKNEQVPTYKTEAQRRAEDKKAIANSWLGRLFRKIFLETPSGKKENFDNLRLETYSNLNPKREYKSAKATNNNTRTSQDKFQARNYKQTRRKQGTTQTTTTAPGRQEQMKDYILPEVAVTAKRPTKRKTTRYSAPKNTVHPDADDTPVTMINPSYIPATDNIQFRPLNYFGMEDPYGRTASEMFDAELAEKAARRQAVLDMYGIAPSGSSVSDLTNQYNHGKNIWW